MKFIYNKSNNKFETSQLLATTEAHEQIAIENGYVAVSDEDYEKLVKHELCWENGVLVPYYKTAEEISVENRQTKLAEINARINNLKLCLVETDYKAIEYAEGCLTEEEYAKIKTQRQNWRTEINALEDEVKKLGGMQ